MESNFSKWREKDRADRSEVAGPLISKLESFVSLKQASLRGLHLNLHTCTSKVHAGGWVKEGGRGFLTCVHTFNYFNQAKR